jgi:hypothetical protein
MSMRISPPLEAVIVALPTGAWIVQRDASLGGTLALAAGAAFFTFAWIVLSPARPATAVPAAAVPAAQPAAPDGCSEHRHGAGERRISRRPTRRGARDVRCSASRATARARRSARR